MPRPYLFLGDCAAYRRYLDEVPSGALHLPPYVENEQGVVLWRGEVFCRVPNCSMGKHPYYSTRILRLHIRSHRKVVGSFGRGYVTQADRDDTIAWYESLFGDNGDEARGVNPENENQSKDAEERGADDEAEDQTESMVQEIKREIMKEITQEIQEEIQEEIKQEMKRETKEKMKREMKEQMKREMKEKMKREMKQKMKREIEKEMME